MTEGTGSFFVAPAHNWLFSVIVMTPDWESVAYGFKYRNFCFWKGRPSLISLILSSKWEKGNCISRMKFFSVLISELEQVTVLLNKI